MKKLLPIAAVGASLITVCTCLTLCLRSNVVKLTASGVEHSITFDASNVSYSVKEDGTTYFDLFKANATRSGDSFGTYVDPVDPEYRYSYVYGGSSQSAGGDHIFHAVSGAYYADAYFGMYFEFKNVLEFVGVEMTGTFYYDAAKEDPETKIEYGSSAFVNNTLTIYEDDFYEVQLDTIKIIYNCAA